MKSIMTMLAVALFAFIAWAAPPPAEASTPTVGTQSVDQNEQMVSVADKLGELEIVTAESVADSAINAISMYNDDATQTCSEVQRGQCPIARYGQPQTIEGGNRLNLGVSATETRPYPMERVPRGSSPVALIMRC